MENSLFKIFSNRRNATMHCKEFQLFCLTVLVLIVSGCSTLNPTMPIKIPIDLSKAGSVAEAEFWIPRDDGIRLYLCFLIDKPEDGKRIFQSLEYYEKSSLARQTLTIPLKIQITKQLSPENHELWLEKTYPTKAHVSTSSKFFERRVDSLLIKSGSYRLRVENIKSFPQFVQSQVEFRIYYGPTYSF